ncbi:hypothetical protein FQN57_005131 [Myotisia sp. PD_48]|nr:hypothetical protein FQN57_005131 [Myotisia sp. PD_48]
MRTVQELTGTATYIADRLIYTYSLSCRRDSATGEFCDSLLIEWLNQPALTAKQNCSDCLLGAGQTHLNSPFGYDDEFASDFRALTSSCSASNYSFTIPPSYTISAPPATATIPRPICANQYTVQLNDTCNSIAEAKNISTYSLIRPNGLSGDCSNLKPGASICLSDSCRTHFLQENDSCAGIIRKYNITSTQFLAWNPNIDPLCGNKYDWLDTFVCISGPTGGATAKAVLAQATPTAAISRPKNAVPQSSQKCARWYTVNGWDTCNAISMEFGITRNAFLSLNPGIDEGCRLRAGSAYCVTAAGEGILPDASSTSPFYTLTPPSYSTKVTTLFTEYPKPSPIPTIDLPKAPGTSQNCKYYRNYTPVPKVADQSQSKQISLVTDTSNDCFYISSLYSVEIKDLLSWNPILKADKCALLPGYSYCVSLNEIPDEPPYQGYTCHDITHVEPGTTPDCSCFTVTFGYDAESYPCDVLVGDFPITMDDLVTWNPWIGRDCEGLYRNLEEQQMRAVCVGVKKVG